METRVETATSLGQRERAKSPACDFHRFVLEALHNDLEVINNMSGRQIINKEILKNSISDIF